MRLVKRVRFFGYDEWKLRFFAIMNGSCAFLLRWMEAYICCYDEWKLRLLDMMNGSCYLFAIMNARFIEWQVLFVAAMRERCGFFVSH